MAFGSAQNPLRHLGTIGFLALWLLAASGVILYALFDTSVNGAWHSVERLAHLPLGLGRLLRGVHRYAGDLLMLVVFLHILREWLHGHAHGARRFHWLTGVPLPGFCFISAIGGFWLAWDQLGQYSALSTAEWLDALPLLASPLARNFLSPAALSDRMFSLFIFVHVGVPLLLLFGLWFHIQRLAHVAMLPPRGLTFGVILALALLALARPVLSHAPAALGQVPAELRLDWLLLWLHPLTDATSRGFTLTLTGGAVLVLFALPFLPRTPRAAVAVVDAENCSGCAWCFADCPYAAVTMVPHPDRRPGHRLAQVDADLCTACGICAGACPSSTPLRRARRLVTGIDMPQLSIDALRRRLRARLAASTAQRPIVVFSCRHGASHDNLHGADLSVLGLICAGQLPPSFVEYAMRNGAAGVLVAACREGGCEFRLGERWMVQRLTRQREPRLRVHAPAERLQLVFAGPGEEALLDQALQGLRERLRAMSPHVSMNANEIVH
ncbi:Cytochrome b subunit of the bc complex [Pollutimonas bauzanensis]|uniref:Cytochrome b subunit of the bc complex n=2 Tax=Pollutimonas bauzanensis TaxID=658167 RepID=A0A1M5Z5Z7_9BURK|nr:Cytochrome b subunit of the bc complex [Pollutimonas bauzanensis]